MSSDLHLRELKEQGEALRAAAVRAGPDAAVPTCPDWDVRRLMRHLTRVYAMARTAMNTGPEGPRPQPPSPPQDFDAALRAWDEQLTEMIDTAAGCDAHRRVWAFFADATPQAWIRRMAHETAIHRLDAEHAGATQVAELLFDPAFAADGIDEFLSVVLGVTGDWTGSRTGGQALFHAADAGRTWLVTFHPQRPPKVDAPHDAALGRPEVDATVAGTADAVYRRVWGRPSTAVTTGDHELAELIAGR